MGGRVCSTTSSRRLCIHLRQTTRGAYRGPRWNPSSLDITGTEEYVQAFVEPTLGDVLATLAALFQVGGHGASKLLSRYLSYRTPCMLYVLHWQNST